MHKKNNKTFSKKLLIILLPVFLLLVVSFFIFPSEHKPLNQSVNTDNIETKNSTTDNTVNTETLTEQPTKKPITPTPRILTSIDKTHQVGTRILFVKYNKNTDETSLSYNQNQENILIGKWKSAVISSESYRNIPTKFYISSDNNYLTYLIQSEWESAISYFYSFVDNKSIELDIAAENYGFTNKNEYFYACAKDAYYGLNGILIYKLPQMELVYERKDSNWWHDCKYNKQNNMLEISYQGKITANYSFGENRLID